jgi:uncharacterized membrane protein YfcA
MFYFLIEVIGVSILVSFFATWIKLVPRYPQKKYNLIQQLLNTALMTILLSILFSLHIYPHWIILFVIILLILCLSVWLTNGYVKRPKDGTAEPAEEETGK